MFYLIYLTSILLQLFVYLFIIFVVLVIGLRLWVEPIKGVCKCSTNLNGKVALITGGNSGIGLETAKDLAKRGAKVYIASRDVKKSEEAVTFIKNSTHNPNVYQLQLDLGDFDDIKRFVEEFNRTEKQLHILVNNAGCAGLAKKITKEGADIIMQINHLGPFLITNLLLNKLTESRPSRIIIVSSYGHKVARFNINDFAGLKTRGHWFRYANSKLCNVLWAKALSERLPDGVTVNCLHPGIVKTDIFKRLPGFIRELLLYVINLVYKTAEEGAQTTIHLCVATELSCSSGGYYSDCKPSQPCELANDEELVQRVWDESMRLVSG